MKLIHVDTVGPYPESLGGSRYYVVMFVDSVSRLQRPYETQDKSVPAILAVVNRFVADMGVPSAFRAENGTEYTNRVFAEYCEGLGIHHELTAPYTPQQNGPKERALARKNNAGLAARLNVNKLFTYMHLEWVRGVWDRVGT